MAGPGSTRSRLREIKENEAEKANGNRKARVLGSLKIHTDFFIDMLTHVRACVRASLFAYRAYRHRAESR